MATSDRVTVGIDIGTTATKAVAVDGGGSVLARSRVRHEVFTPEPDLLEHDAGRAWRRGPIKALAEVSTAVSGRDLAGVCVAGMVPSLTAVGARGYPCAPGLLYGDRRDSRYRPEGRSGGPAEGGAGPDPAASASDNSTGGIPDAQGFMRFLVREFPGARGYWPAQAVADYGLCGVPAIDTATSMSLGGLMTFGQWDDAVLDRIGVTKKQLPVIVPMGEAAGEVKGTSAVLAGGTVDALCDQIVAGAEEPGDVLVICGATLVVWAVVSDWIEAPGLLTVPHTVSGRVLVGGPSNAGALFVDWARALLDGGLSGRRGASSTRERAEVADGTDTGSDPWSVPVWTPYVRGERAPFHDPMLRSCLYGLDITHRAASLERAAYEASGFVVRRMLETAGIRARRIVASGGGTRVRGWMQAIADTTGLPVEVVAVHEGAALGAAYFARMAAGLTDGLEGSSSWARVGERIEPDGRWKDAVNERYERFVSVESR
jgi:xylulokinase